MLGKLSELQQRDGVKKSQKAPHREAISRQAIVTAAWILALLAFAECLSSRNSDFLARKKEK